MGSNLWSWHRAHPMPKPRKINVALVISLRISSLHPGIVPFVDAMAEKASGDHVIKVFWVDLVARQLLAYELIIGRSPLRLRIRIPIKISGVTAIRPVPV